MVKRKTNGKANKDEFIRKLAELKRRSKNRKKKK